MKYPLFPSRLRRLREDRNLTQTQLARSTGLSHAAISRWEAGHREPHEANIDTLALYFEVPKTTLTGGGEVGRGLILEGDVSIGLGCKIGHNVVLAATHGKRIVIGDGCSLGHGVTIVTRAGKLVDRKITPTTGDVIIGANCVIGDGVVVLPDQEVPEDTVCAPNGVLGAWHGQEDPR